jgi:DedD protein
MGESNIEDLILAEPEENKPKQRGILIILGLVVLLLVLGVVLANMIFGSSSDVNATKQEVKQEEIKQVNQNNANMTTDATDLKDENLDADLAPLDEQEANNVEVVKAQEQKLSNQEARKESKKEDNDLKEIDDNEAMEITKVKKEPKKVEPKKVVEHKPKPKPVHKSKPVHKVKTYGGAGSVYIQVGSFSKGPNQAFIDKIRRAGFKYKIVQAGPYRRVFVGPFRSTQEAKSVLGIVRSKISSNAFIKK